MSSVTLASLQCFVIFLGLDPFCNFIAALITSSESPSTTVSRIPKRISIQSPYSNAANSISLLVGSPTD